MTRLTRVERLQLLCDVWGRVLLFHPAIARGDPPLDWAAAFDVALSALESSEDAHATAAVVNDVLLAQLHDPFSFAQPPSEVVPCSPAAAAPALPHAGRSLTLLPDAIGHPEFLSAFSSAMRSRRDDDLIVVDLRWGRSCEHTMRSDFLGCWLREARDVPRVTRVHHGWHELPHPYVYSQQWERAPARRLNPLEPFIDAPTLVIVDNASILHVEQALAALQGASSVRVAWQRTGPLSMPPGRALRYAGGISVHLHLAYPPFLPDLAVVVPISDVAFAETYAAAVRREHTDATPRAGDVVLPRVAVGGFTGADAPSRGERLTGLAKAATVIEHCYPHLDRASLAPGDILRRWLQPMDAADSWEAYCAVLEEVLAALHDSHAAVSHPLMQDAERASVSAKLTLQADGPVVTHAWGHAPLQPGDAILELDGRPFAEIATAWRGRISASSDQAFYRDLLERMWRGPDGTFLEVACRRGDERHHLLVPREAVPPPAVRQPVAAAELALPGCGRAVEMTGDRLGCLRPFDISSARALDVAMEMIRDAHGLLLDLRGYPIVHFQHALVRRLCAGAVQSPLYEIPIATGTGPPGDRWQVIRYTVRPEDEHPAPLVFNKPVVALIDERTQSSAEDLCMYLRIARRVTFVGRPTAGCHGNAAFAFLPGGVCIRFTGMRVRWPDGAPFQGVGIVPDVPDAGDPVAQGLDLLRGLVSRT